MKSLQTADGVKKEILDEGERISNDQKMRQHTLDDFENLSLEKEFLDKLETGEEKIIRSTKTVGEHFSPDGANT